MQPFINPYLFQQPQMQMQPYQYQSQTMPSARTVNDFSEITANDVSMSQPYAVFVKNDMKSLQLRRWNANGQIEITDFDAKICNLTPENCENPSNLALKNEILALNEKVDEIRKMLKPGKKKEVEE